MHAAVALEGLEALAGEFDAQATMEQAPGVGAGPDFAVGTAGVNVKAIGAAAATRVAFRWPPTSSGLSQEVCPSRERGPVMVTRAAVQPARTEQ
jgi:hypothetical protein